MVENTSISTTEDDEKVAQTYDELLSMLLEEMEKIAKQSNALRKRMQAIAVLTKAATKVVDGEMKDWIKKAHKLEEELEKEPVSDEGQNRSAFVEGYQSALDILEYLAENTTLTAAQMHAQMVGHKHIKLGMWLVTTTGKNTAPPAFKHVALLPLTE
jgi:nitrogenase molybdenum-iron protein alpha/beta subunit